MWLKKLIYKMCSLKEKYVPQITLKSSQSSPQISGKLLRFAIRGGLNWGLYGITELQDFEQLKDAIFYTEVSNPEVAPKMVFQLKIALAVLGKLKFFIFTFCRMQTILNKQVLKNRTLFLPWQCPSVTTSQSFMKL